MKATELMIGDWVQIHYRNKTVRVTGIHNGLIETSAVGPLQEDEVEPVPLTVEILRENGFDCDDVADETYGEEIEVILELHEWMIEDERGWPESWFGNRIKYVHQLQRALRLLEIQKDIEL